MAKQNMSFSFTKFQLRTGEIVVRPMLPVIIKHRKREFKTNLLVDSGADVSMIRKEILEFLEIDIHSLTETGKTQCADGGSSSISTIELDVEVSQGKNKWIDTIPFQVFLGKGKDPDPPLLGRHPFFSHYRVDFRMGFTNDPTLGKFVIYREDVKRDSKKYGKKKKKRR